MAKKTAVSLILFTKLPHHGLVAILNKRGDFDFEDFEPETYPHIYEATAGGAVDSQEHLIEGLLREVAEEMGGATAKHIKHYAASMQIVARHENEKINAYTYALFIPHFPLALLKPHRSSAGIRTISVHDLGKIKSISSIPDYNKKLPPPDGHPWMLADQLEGLKRGFALYK